MLDQAAAKLKEDGQIDLAKKLESLDVRDGQSLAICDNRKLTTLSKISILSEKLGQDGGRRNADGETV